MSNAVNTLSLIDKDVNRIDSAILTINKIQNAVQPLINLHHDVSRKNVSQVHPSHSSKFEELQFTIKAQLSPLLEKLDAMSFVSLNLTKLSNFPQLSQLKADLTDVRFSLLSAQSKIGSSFIKDVI